VDLSRFENEVTGYIRDWIAAAEVPASTLRERSTGWFFVRIFDAMRRAGLAAPPTMSRMFRTVAVADMVMLKLDPQMDWRPIVRRFVHEQRVRVAESRMGEALSADRLAALIETVVDAPQLAAGLSEWLGTRLPELGRAYGQQSSRMDRVLALSLRYIRLLVVAVTAAVLASHFVAPAVAPDGIWADLGEGLGEWWLPLALAGVLGALVLRRLSREFEPR
jgi:hypothetical protein